MKEIRIPARLEAEKKRPIPAKFLQDYLETLVGAQAFQTSNLRNCSLMQCYAELQFKLNGGAKCVMCRAHVRHVVPVRAEYQDGALKEFACLCNRCFEGERAVCKVLVLKLGDASVEHYPREYGACSSDGRVARAIPIDSSKAK